MILTFLLATALLAAGAAHAAPPPAAAPGGDTLRHVVTLPVVEVNTAHVDARAPIASSTLGREALRAGNWGQDTPMALATQPGAYAYSDAGNGIGYSYLAIRGFPQRRISVMVDGVPLNDPESHEVWWIDLPDLLASAGAVQVQRGVGPALYGAAALGGSVDVETSEPDPAGHASASVAAGSFGTRRVSLAGTSAVTPGGWQLSGRYSRIETDGYRVQSWSRLWSYAFAARRVTDTQQFRLNLFGGPENTHLAYLGIPPDYLAGRIDGNATSDRRWNPITYPGEQDHYFEPHYAFTHAWAPRHDLAFTQTAFWFDGSGYYDEQRSGVALADYRLAPWTTTDPTQFPASWYVTDDQGRPVADAQGRYTVERGDIVRRRDVVNQHFGWIPRLRWSHARGELTLGGELRWHDGHHVGTLVSGDGLPPGTPADAAYYDYHPRTFAAGLFVREAYDVRPALRVTADLAWRHQHYAMRDDRFDGVRFDQSYDFGLPRLGVSWKPAERWSAFASWAYASREPAFRDLYDAEGVGSLPLYRVVDVAAGIYRDPLVTPEHVQHAELGGEWRGRDAGVSANVFYMDFHDELVYAGQFNTDLGYPILGNAARSVHEGLELSAHAGRTLGTVRAELAGNATLSDNHFVDYVEHYGPSAADDVHYDGNALGFFPATMANVSGRLAWRGLSAEVQGQGVGRIYVDNTETASASIAPHTVANVVLAATRAVGGATVEVSLRVFNVADLRYATGGYMDVDPNDPSGSRYVPWLTPAATRNWLMGLRVDW